MSKPAINCPKCSATSRQIKDGYTKAQSQRYRCRQCNCRYTPAPQVQGYEEEIRFQALQLYLDGLSMREVARQLGVNHQSIANWIKDYARYLPPDLPPDLMKKAQLEGLYVL